MFNFNLGSLAVVAASGVIAEGEGLRGAVLVVVVVVVVPVRLAGPDVAMERGNGLVKSRRSPSFFSE